MICVETFGVPVLVSIICRASYRLSYVKFTNTDQRIFELALFCVLVKFK